MVWPVACAYGECVCSSLSLAHPSCLLKVYFSRVSVSGSELCSDMQRYLPSVCLHLGSSETSPVSTPWDPTSLSACVIHWLHRQMPQSLTWPPPLPSLPTTRLCFLRGDPGPTHSLPVHCGGQLSSLTLPSRDLLMDAHPPSAPVHMQSTLCDSKHSLITPPVPLEVLPSEEGQSPSPLCETCAWLAPRSLCQGFPQFPEQAPSSLSTPAPPNLPLHCAPPAPQLSVLCLHSTGWVAMWHCELMG